MADIVLLAIPWDVAEDVLVSLGDLSGKIIIDPVNPRGAILVRTNPDRAQKNHAFLFALPSAFRDGTVRLTGMLNPFGSPVEGRVSNNSVSTSVTFETVPEQNLVMYNFGYSQDGVHFPTDDERAQMVVWMRRAYPIRRMQVVLRSQFVGRGLPTCNQINNILLGKRAIDARFSNIPMSIPS